MIPARRNACTNWRWKIRKAIKSGATDIIVAAEITPYVNEWDEAEEFPRELYQKVGAIGLFGGADSDVLPRPIHVLSSKTDCVNFAIFQRHRTASVSVRGRPAASRRARRP